MTTTPSERGRPRYVCDRPFPSYSYVPGREPHPISHPQGHSYGQTLSIIVPELETLTREARYLYGVDLFNYGFYWEAHETWESLWRGSSSTENDEDLRALRLFLQGLIKLAASAVKAREGSAQGAARHALGASVLFQTAMHHLHENEAEKANKPCDCAIMGGLCLEELIFNGSDMASRFHQLHERLSRNPLDPMSGLGDSPHPGIWLTPEFRFPFVLRLVTDPPADTQPPSPTHE